MKNYRFYNLDGDSIEVFGISDTVFNEELVDIFGVSEITIGNVDHVGKVMGLLQSEQITGIEYDFIVSASEFLEIDKYGHKMKKITTTYRDHQKWLEQNKTRLHKMIFQNQFNNLEYITRIAFEAGVDSQK